MRGCRRHGREAPGHEEGTDDGASGAPDRSNVWHECVPAFLSPARRKPLLEAAFEANHRLVRCLPATRNVTFGRGPPAARQTGRTMDTTEIEVDASRERIVDLSRELERSACRARRRAGERLRAPCHGRAGVDGTRIGLGGGSCRRPRSATAAPRPVPPCPWIGWSRSRSPASRPHQPVGHPAPHRGSCRPRDLAIPCPGRPQRRQPSAPGALQLPARLASIA